MKLRPYQEETVKKGVDFLLNKKTKNPALIVAPTGTGKSVMIAGIVSQLDAPAIILQPSVELLHQNYQKYLAFGQKKDAAIYSASAGKREIAKATYATIGTIKAVPELFQHCKYLIIDEAHLYPASTDSMFGGFLMKNEQLKVLGLTATPFRLQSYMTGSKLVMLNRSHIYKRFLHIIQIKEIASKYWANIDYITEKVNKNGLRVNTSGAEFTEESIQTFGLTVQGLIEHHIKTRKEKSILVFVPSIAQAVELSRAYPGSAAVSSKTPKKERAKIIEMFKAGHIRIVFNVNLLGVGFDFPELACIIDANPTLSLARYYQKIGRLTRIPQGQETKQAVYIDLAGNTERFGRIEDLSIQNYRSMYHVFSDKTQLTGKYIDSISLGEDNLTYFQSLSERHEELVKQLPLQTFENVILDFGKFNGKAISDVPIDYLRWCVKEITSRPKIIQNIKIYLNSTAQ